MVIVGGAVVALAVPIEMLLPKWSTMVATIVETALVELPRSGRRIANASTIRGVKMSNFFI